MRNGEWSKLVSVVGRILLAFLFVFLQSAWAGQDPRAKDNPKPVQNASQQLIEKSSSTATTAEAETEEAQGQTSDKTAAEEKSSGDGKHEGIKVHGHWTIEVRNPDGKLVTHREFENALISSGATLLGNLLQGVYVPAAWLLHVGGTNGSQTPANAANPCGPGAFGADGSFLNTGVTSGPPQVAYCNVIETGAACTQAMGFAPASTFCTLARTPAAGTVVVSGTGTTAISLSGAFQATNSGYIGTVVSEDEVCSSNPGNHQTPGLAAVSPSACNAGNGAIIQTNFFTAAVLAAPIQVQAGQTVAVTVQYSFQ